MRSRISNGRSETEVFIIPTPPEDQRTQEMRFWLSVLRVHNTIFPELNKSLRDNAGVGLAKFDVLAQLVRNPNGITMGDLSTALKVTNGNVSGLVNRLIKDGLVSRKMSETDRRSFSVMLTEQGLATFHKALAFHQSTLAEVLADVERDTLTEATEPLRHLAERLKQRGQVDE